MKTGESFSVKSNLWDFLYQSISLSMSKMEVTQALDLIIILG